MKKDIILYTLSTALSRGSILIFFPIVSSMLSLGQFGIWSLTLVTINLLIPILCLNGPSAILREGSENLNSIYHLIGSYAAITVVITFISYISSFQLEDLYWLKFSIIIAFFEALILLFTTALRVFEKSGLFFFINILKTILILFAIIYARTYNYSLTKLLTIHCMAVFFSFILTVIYFCYFYLNESIVKFNKISKDLLKSSILFSTILIPHGISQWLMSSSDRFILELLTNDVELGKYSIAYSLALVLGLINTAIGLTLPVYVIKNYKSWLTDKADNKYIMIYTFISICLFVIILASYLIDWKFFNILKHYDNEIILLFLILFNGLYVLGIYYFFVNYLFYHKRSSLISITTLITAGINVSFTLILSYYLGAIGAALATLISYFIYLIIVRYLALKMEPKITISLFKPIFYMLSSSSIATLGAFLIV